ncbi:Elongation of very long chain fatty acids protein [Ooceraea biroi]|uniref:Elongation of very long chain fatty acids protein n=1 Tax=Ooceraea biroi TaxID=2015173 RepID=A0A026VXI9_OOCBI|nr:Elongation of very long chain fatty acids protein [Ooceraea biroi]
MKKRQPFKLDRILQIYNILQIMISLFIFAEFSNYLFQAVRIWFFTHYSFICQPVDYSNTPEAIRITRDVWLYFMNKLFDLLDTVFFVLKKKQNQMSFLHIYHHVGIVICAWFTVKYLPGGHGTFLGLVNTFVHAIMYLYYLLSSMKININYWKKYITQMQIIQFFIIAVHFAKLLWVDCGYPQWTAFVMIPQNIFMIVLFSDFYYKIYIKKKPIKKVIPTKSDVNDITADIVNKKSKDQ